MKKLLFVLVCISISIVCITCDYKKSTSDNNNVVKSDWKFKVVTNIDSTEIKLIIVDKNNNPIKYDDEADYSNHKIIEYAFYANAIFMDANNHTISGYYYFKNYDIVNQNINYVFNLPIKDEILDESVKELFNRCYYNYKDYEIYKYDKGYGFQSFIMSKDGKIHRGYYGVTNPTLKLSRNDEGNIEIYWIPLPR